MCPQKRLDFGVRGVGKNGMSKGMIDRKRKKKQNRPRGLAKKENNEILI